jgi:hypothetical protein
MTRQAGGWSHYHFVDAVSEYFEAFLSLAGLSYLMAGESAHIEHREAAGSVRAACPR